MDFSFEETNKGTYSPFFKILQRFQVEFDSAFLDAEGDRFVKTGSRRYRLAAKGILEVSRKVLSHDIYQGLEPVLEFGQVCLLSTFPVEVAFRPETGFECDYRSTMCLPVWKIDLTR